MDDCQRADYLILVHGGSVRCIKDHTKANAILAARFESDKHKTSVALVEVIGEVQLEARWVDAKDSN